MHVLVSHVRRVRAGHEPCNTPEVVLPVEEIDRLPRSVPVALESPPVRALKQPDRTGERHIPHAPVDRLDPRMHTRVFRAEQTKRSAVAVERVDLFHHHHGHRLAAGVDEHYLLAALQAAYHLGVALPGRAQREGYGPRGTVDEPAALHHALVVLTGGSACKR